MRELFHAKPRSVEQTLPAAPGVNVVIPIHSNRLDTFRLTIQSLSDQVFHNQHPHAVFSEGPVNLILANNGLAQEDLAVIEELTHEAGIPLYVVDAMPTEDHHKSAAYGRNQALSFLREQLFTNPELHLDSVLFLDSDSALLPGSLQAMYSSLKANPDTVAVTADVVPVDALTGDLYTRRSQRRLASDAPLRRLPRLINARGFDMNGMIAYSSQIAGKTNGLLLSSDVVLDMPHHNFPLLRSGEDMSFSAAITRHGHIVFDAQGAVLDQARQSEEQMFHQQLQWGRDHQVLLDHLVDLGLVEPGIHVLLPKGNSHWEEFVLPNSQDVTGFIVNPFEIQNVAAHLRTQLEQGTLPLYESAPTVLKDLDMLDTLLTRITTELPKLRPLMRDDLPRPDHYDDPSNPRQLSASKLGRLAGNLLGIDYINGSNYQGLPPKFAIGLRQPGVWE